MYGSVVRDLEERVDVQTVGIDTCFVCLHGQEVDNFCEKDRIVDGQLWKL